MPVSAEKPHGLDYSLTLHDDENNRLLPFDNAHSVRQSAGPVGRTRVQYDHKRNAFAFTTIAMPLPC